MASSELIKDIENIFSAKELSAVQLRTYRPDRLIKIVIRLEANEENCTTCKTLKAKLIEILVLIKEQSPISEEVQYAYMSLFRKMLDHLKSKHNLSYRGYYSSLYSLIGILALSAFWLLIFWISTSLFDKVIPIKIGFLVAAMTGLVLGRILGSKKDKKLLKANKNLY